jgi:hypothetical protein
VLWRREMPRQSTSLSGLSLVRGLRPLGKPCCLKSRRMKSGWRAWNKVTATRRAPSVGSRASRKRASKSRRQPRGESLRILRDVTVRESCPKVLLFTIDGLILGRMLQSRESHRPMESRKGFRQGKRAAATRISTMFLTLNSENCKRPIAPRANQATQARVSRRNRLCHLSSSRKGSRKRAAQGLRKRYESSRLHRAECFSVKDLNSPFAKEALLWSLAALRRR